MNKPTPITKEWIIYTETLSMEEVKVLVADLTDTEKEEIKKIQDSMDFNEKEFEEIRKRIENGDQDVWKKE